MLTHIHLHWPLSCQHLETASMMIICMGHCWSTCGSDLGMQLSNFLFPPNLKRAALTIQTMLFSESVIYFKKRTDKMHKIREVPWLYAFFSTFQNYCSMTALPCFPSAECICLMFLLQKVISGYTTNQVWDVRSLAMHWRVTVRLPQHFCKAQVFPRVFLDRVPPSWKENKFIRRVAVLWSTPPLGWFVVSQLLWQVFEIAL